MTDGRSAPRDGPREAICIAFASHHVVVECPSGRILEAVRASFGPMAQRVPTGTCAGTLAVGEREGVLRVGAPGSGTLPIPENAAAAARELHHAAAKLLIEARADLAWLHAGVAAFDDAAHVFCGATGAGKSTIVATLLELGWTYLSDEIAAIDTSSGVVHPFPLAPLRRFHDGPWLGDVARVRRLPKSAVPLPSDRIARRELPLAAVYSLHHRPTGTTVATSCPPPAHMVLELIRNSMRVSSTDRSGEIGLLARLVERIPHLRMDYPDPVRAARHVHALASSRRSHR